ncbi:MAG TPA: cyclic pyranopterin monophosphate synthase MoaC, partial [Anaerolineaceae bacterium]|nr:cyclic pyranopterin monophosphate synthase MoaC [Anaerolineaceae bacterium]
MTHLDEKGRAIMVDITEKYMTDRVATASGKVRMQPETLQMIRSEKVQKGDVLAVARVAGIMAAKKCAELIPLCHPIALTSAKIDFEFVDDNTIRIIAETKTTYATGIEMEALTAVSVAALTIYDMCKAVDRAMVIGEIQLENKSGGRSGVYNREEQA